MKKYFQSTLLLAVLSALFLIACDKTVNPEKDPLNIESEITHCSLYGSIDGKIDITVTGGSKPYTYIWSTGESVEDLTNISAGTFQLEVKDNDGDALTKSFTVNSPAKLDMNLSVDVVNCTGFNKSDGKIYLTVTGGLQPYSYLWSNGTSSKDLINAPAGLYTTVVTDAEGATEEVSAEITQPDPDPIIIIFIVKPSSGEDANDGFIDVTVTGGVKPYTFLWSNGETTEDIINLVEGDYKLVVTDALNNTIEETINVGVFETGTVTDIDGNVYKTIKIGNQWWMAENLKVTRDPDGNEVTSYIYNNDQNCLDTYGRLYNWDTAMNGSAEKGARGIAPEGWHIPTRDEWQELFTLLGGINSAGGKLKETGTDYWNFPNINATNLYGFNGRGSGEKAGANENYIYQFLNKVAVYWTSEFANNNAYYYVLSNDKSSVNEWLFHKDYSYSIRCIKNN